MKALSVGLVKGSIDEVDKRVHMTWVQPRVLDLQQVALGSPPQVVRMVSAVLVSLGWKPFRKKAVLTRGFREYITAVGTKGF